MGQTLLQEGLLVEANEYLERAISKVCFMLPFRSISYVTQPYIMYDRVNLKSCLSNFIRKSVPYSV